MSKDRQAANAAIFPVFTGCTNLAGASVMARIRTTHQAFRTKVSIQGRLTAADMRRLEHACASALVAQPLRLGIDIRQVTEIDATAAAFLARLKTRGAVILPEFTGGHLSPAPRAARE
jgi:hypothetical protein